MSSVFQIKDLTILILANIEPEFYKNIAPVCKTWYNIIETQKRKIFLELMSEDVLPNNLRFVWLNLLNNKVLLPEVGYKSLVTTNFYETVILYKFKKDNCRLSVKGNIKYNVFQKYKYYYRQMYKKRLCCQFCNSQLEYYTVHKDCQHKFTYEYFIPEKTKNIRLPILIDKMYNITFLIKLNGNHYIRGKNEPLDKWVEKNGHFPFYKLLKKYNLDNF